MHNHYLSKIALAVSLVIVLGSCTSQYKYLEAYQVEKSSEKHSDESVEKATEERLKIQTNFAGDALNYLVFEMDIENVTDDSIYLSAQDIQLSVYTYDAVINLPHLDKGRIIYGLKDEKRRIKKQKKTRLITNILFTTLNVIGAASGNAADIIITSADGAIITAEENRYFKLVDGDIDQQIEYLEDWMFDGSWLQPGEKYSWDLLFERKLHEGEVELEIIEMDQVYVFDYELFIREQSN